MMRACLSRRKRLCGYRTPARRLIHTNTPILTCEHTHIHACMHAARTHLYCVQAQRRDAAAPIADNTFVVRRLYNRAEDEVCCRHPYIHACIDTHTHTHTHIHTRAHTRTHTRAHAHTHARARARARTHNRPHAIRCCTHSQWHTHAPECAHNTHTHTPNNTQPPRAHAHMATQTRTQLLTAARRGSRDRRGGPVVPR